MLRRTNSLSHTDSANLTFGGEEGKRCYALSIKTVFSLPQGYQASWISKGDRGFSHSPSVGTIAPFHADIAQPLSVSKSKTK